MNKIGYKNIILVFIILSIILIFKVRALEIGGNRVKDPVPGYKWLVQDYSENHPGWDIVGKYPAGWIKDEKDSFSIENQSIYPVMDGKVFAIKEGRSLMAVASGTLRNPLLIEIPAYFREGEVVVK